jgi:hypothetical protein
MRFGLGVPTPGGPWKVRIKLKSNISLKWKHPFVQRLILARRDSSQSSFSDTGNKTSDRPHEYTSIDETNQVCPSISSEGSTSELAEIVSGSFSFCDEVYSGWLPVEEAGRVTQVGFLLVDDR